MKSILGLILLIFIANSVYSQDLIVTNDGDSVNCKITKVETDNIYFTFKHNDEIRNTLLPISNVKIHQFNFYQTSAVSEEKVTGYKSYQHFRFAVNGGFSYQTAQIAKSVPADFKEYIRELKSGYHFSGGLTYYFSRQLGAGIRYSVFKSSNSLDNIYLEDTYGNRTYGEMSDDLKISFIGPSFSTRFMNSDKGNAFVMSLALGYMGYSDKKVIIDKYKMTGGTVGLAFDIGYDIGLSENLSLGFQMSVISGALSEFDLDDGIKKETVKLNEGEFESLNRVDFSVGLRFSK